MGLFHKDVICRNGPQQSLQRSHITENAHVLPHFLAAELAEIPTTMSGHRDDGPAWASVVV